MPPREEKGRFNSRGFGQGFLQQVLNPAASGVKQPILGATQNLSESSPFNPEKSPFRMDIKDKDGKSRYDREAEMKQKEAEKDKRPVKNTLREQAGDDPMKHLSKETMVNGYAFIRTMQNQDQQTINAEWPSFMMRMMLKDPAVDQVFDISKPPTQSELKEIYADLTSGVK